MSRRRPDDSSAQERGSLNGCGVARDSGEKSALPVGVGRFFFSVVVLICLTNVYFFIEAFGDLYRAYLAVDRKYRNNIAYNNYTQIYVLTYLIHDRGRKLIFTGLKA